MVSTIITITHSHIHAAIQVGGDCINTTPAHVNQQDKNAQLFFMRSHV